MKIDATIQEIRGLLQIAEIDGQAQELTPEAYRTRREASRRRVAKALLERYESLLEAGRYPVLVAIERGKCSGCHVRLPTSLEYLARQAPAIHSCPHCRRMLYASELLSRESDTSASGKGGRASGRGAPASARQQHS
jgi:predicted  nucleic acid-binding Zn-ribbon protein